MEPRVPLSFTRELHLGHGMSRNGMSRSSPSLAAAFSLRQYSLDKRHIAADHSEENLRAKLQPLEEIDLLGGNGRWRQVKAKSEWERRAIEEKEQKRQLALQEEQKRLRREDMKRRRRKQQEEEEKRRRDERERQRREQEEKERLQHEREERERLRRETEEREMLRRQPKICETCNGGCKCTQCGGKGFFFATFLATGVTKDTSVEYGRNMQGCEACGGCTHNILGELKMGSGKCAPCQGFGKIWPNLEVTSPWNRRQRGQTLPTAAPAATPAAKAGVAFETPLETTEAEERRPSKGDDVDEVPPEESQANKK